MNSLSKILLILFVPVWFLFAACLEKVEFPIEPAIQFNGFAKIIDSTGIDNRGVLEIYYQDGDGDIGLTERIPCLPTITISMSVILKRSTGSFRRYSSLL